MAGQAMIVSVADMKVPEPMEPVKLPSILDGFKITTEISNAPLMAKFIRERNGVVRWKSIDLSDLSFGMLGPRIGPDGKETTKPSWKCANEPEFQVTDPAEIGIIAEKEVKRFRVGIRMASQGFCMKVTDGGTRRIRSEVEKAGDGATYQFDYETQEAVIMKADKIISLKQWMEENPGK